MGPYEFAGSVLPLSGDYLTLTHRHITIRQSVWCSVNNAETIHSACVCVPDEQSLRRLTLHYFVIHHQYQYKQHFVVVYIVSSLLPPPPQLESTKVIAEGINETTSTGNTPQRISIIVAPRSPDRTHIEPSAVVLRAAYQLTIENKTSTDSGIFRQIFQCGQPHADSVAKSPTR